MSNKIPLNLVTVIVLLFIVIGFLIFIVAVKMGSEATQCSLNPLVYGAGLLEKSNYGKSVLCSCKLLSDNSPTLFFNSNNSWFELYSGASTNKSYEQINFSALIFRNGNT